MNKFSRFVLPGILLFVLTFTSVQAQRTLGVSWNLPEDETEAFQQLQQFQDMGISVLELQALPSEAIWKAINNSNLTVYGDLGIKFPTAHTFTDADSTFKRQIHQKVTAFTAQPAVIALKLFSYGAVHQPDFNQATAAFFAGFQQAQEIPTYYTDSRMGIQIEPAADFFIYDIRPSQNPLMRSLPDSSTQGYYYHPSGDYKELLTPLKQIVQEIAAHPQAPLFLDSDWLLSMVEQHPRLEATLCSLASDADPVFPVPDESWPTQGQSALPIIVLLLVWGVLAYHYNMSPLYRKSLFRYFTGHRFFLSDIFHQHIRSSIPALVIIFQHALLIAAVFYTVSISSWSGLGLQSVRYHFPGLFFISGTAYDIFITTSGAALIFSLISVLWLYLSHKSLRSLKQIMTLFAWPLQINFLLGTFAIAMYVSGGSAAIITLTTSVMVVVCLGSFIITARDATQSLAVDQLRYMSLTAGLYLIVLAALAVWIWQFNDPFWQVIDLSLELI